MSPADRKMPWLLVLVPVLGLALGFALRVATRPAVVESAAAAAAATGPLRPDFRLTALDGEAISSGDLRGRVVLVDFWASWCGPCRIQAEILEPLYEEYGDEVTFLAVNLGESVETVRDHLSSEPMSYRVLLDPAEALGSALGIYALPTVALFDRDGRVAYLHQGITERRALERELAKLGLDASLGS